MIPKTFSQFIQRKNKVFLGGTCNNTTWRESLIQHLKIEYFNPIVKDWTSADQKNEEIQKKICNIHLYFITSAMKGIYSIAELVNDSHNKNITTIFYLNTTGFDKGELMSFDAMINNILTPNNVKIFKDVSIDQLANYINKKI